MFHSSPWWSLGPALQQNTIIGRLQTQAADHYSKYLGRHFFRTKMHAFGFDAESRQQRDRNRGEASHQHQRPGIIAAPVERQTRLQRQVDGGE